MGKFPVLPKEDLVREIAGFGLSQKEFAAEVGVSEGTITRALEGKDLRTKSWGRILAGLKKLHAAQEVAS